MGHPSDHVEDVGLRHAKDADIWEYALLHKTAIITKDDDFVERFRRQSGGPPIVWLRIGNASNRALLGWFLIAVPAVLKRLEAGDRLIEVR
jgi:predicted nuclease of predicted toxin-antitoxin system